MFKWRPKSHFLSFNGGELIHHHDEPKLLIKENSGHSRLLKMKPLCYPFFMNILPPNENNCPYLILAPMEGVGDRCFRKAMASIGGFDEAVTEFIRIPRQAHLPSIVKDYASDELAPFPIAAQLMGSEPELMALAAIEMEKRGAPRIDLNCGCPSNTVTGRGAGSSLLQHPEFLYEIASAMVKAVKVPVTVKMRSGFADISLFRENLLAAQESGVRFITLHPRTKVDGYGPPARWDLIAEAKSILSIPLVGNGDILTVADAKNMLKQTNCDALMIGRGSVINPFIFHQIKADFANGHYHPRWEDLEKYIHVYFEAIPKDMREVSQLGKLKQLTGFLFKANSDLLERRQQMLSTPYKSVDHFLEVVLPLLREFFFTLK